MILFLLHFLILLYFNHFFLACKVHRTRLKKQYKKYALKMLPGSRAAFSSPRSRFLHYTDETKAVNNVFILFPAVNWLTSGFVYATLSLNRLARRVRNRTSEKLSLGKGVISLSYWLRLITLTSILIILDITKTSSNNRLVICH